MAESAAAINDQIEQGPAQIGSNKPDSGNFNSFQWLLAWAVLIVTLIFISRTRIGYLAIYYGCALLVIFLLVTQYKWFAGVLAPFSSLRPGVVAGGNGASGTSSGPTTPAVGAQPGAAQAAAQFGVQ